MRFLSVAAWICLMSTPTLADEPNDKEAAKYWHKVYRERAAELVAQTGDDEPVELALVSEPVQAWTNPVRGDTQHGTVHLWTKEGRPSVIGSIWSALDPKDRSRRNLCYEFHSLSDVPLTVKHNDKSWWSPKEPGIKWQDLPGFAEPMTSRTARLRQMREIAREFRAESGEKNELRLLTQPLYRYPETTAGATDGAVFAFVIATDPELFLLIEAQTDGVTGERSWKWAPARFTGDNMVLRRGESLVWESPRWEYSRDKVYDFLYGVEGFPDVVKE